MHLDGELFGGRKKFQSTVSIVKTPEHQNWNKIVYHVRILVSDMFISYTVNALIFLGIKFCAFQ